MRPLRNRFELSLSDGTSKRGKVARNRRYVVLLTAIFVFTAGGLLAVAESSNLFVPKFQVFPDPDGAFANLNLGGPTDTATNPFFQDLGTNGRRCVTCHQPSDAFSVTPPHIRARFEATQGTDPLFRPVDGANCPTADVSTLDARREAYSLLLTRGLIRIGIAVPANADYQVMSVNNSVRMQSNRCHFDVSAAAADHQSSVLERRDVRRPRIFASYRYNQNRLQQLSDLR